MTRAEVTEIFAVLMMAYPNAEMFKAPDKDSLKAKLAPTITLWTTCLRDIDFWAAQQAVIRVCQTCKFPPTIAEMREAAETVLHEVRSEISNAYLMARNELQLARLAGRTKEQALEGMPRHASTHAAGVVITRKPVYEYVPLAKNDESVVCQYIMTTLEELGLLKMDFLGLRNLTVLDDAARLVRRSHPDFHTSQIPEDDPATFQMLSEGRTSGVFQMESAGMTGVCIGLKPQSIEDITAIIALAVMIFGFLVSREGPDIQSIILPAQTDTATVQSAPAPDND